jgi:hypothetical protein
MKSAAGHQPNLYPYGGFFAKAACVDEFIIVDTVQYVKKEYHNRNKIKFSDGTAKWLSIPVKNAGRYKQLIKDTEIDNSKDWRNSHLRTFELNYKKTPFFAEIFPLLEKLLSHEHSMLATYNIAFIREVFEYLKINVRLSIASGLNIYGTSTELIFNVCKAVNASVYVHGIHSLDYVDFKYLAENGVQSKIQYFIPPVYTQINGAFIPNLSIIDVLFNCGKESRTILEKANTIQQHSL